MKMKTCLTVLAFLFSFISTDIIIWAKISADIKYCMGDSRAVTYDHRNQ